MSDWDDLVKKIRLGPLGHPFYYGRKGEPISVEEWSQRHADIEYRRVGYNEFPATSRYPASYVSTVWLGINHNWHPDGPPIIFESMRFELDANVESPFVGGRRMHRALEFPYPEPPHEYLEQARYCTEEQASIGHRNIVRLIQEMEMT